jgi:hypothetical protein
MRQQSCYLVVAAFTSFQVLGSSPAPGGEPAALFEVRSGGVDSVQVSLNETAIAELKQTVGRQRLFVPIPGGGVETAEVERFNIIGPACRIVAMTRSGPQALPIPNVATFRGEIAGHPMSHVFLAMSENGATRGTIQLDSDLYYVSSLADAGGRATSEVVIHRPQALGDGDEAASFCGVDSSGIHHAVSAEARGSVPNNKGPRLGHLAIEADQLFVNFFADTTETSNYIVQLVAAIDDIYLRDLNLRLSLDFLRMWPDGGEPFSPADLGAFAEYWQTNEDPSPYNLIHMLSGNRVTSYAGIAYLGGTCDLGRTYGISGYLNGQFASPVGAPNAQNWDVIVPAHEMGHNLGTGHTHDSYTPVIDSCGNTPGALSRGTIMSYCHTQNGGVWNIDMWMHNRVEAVIESDLTTGGCYGYDCNGNNVPDDADIAAEFSLDVNGDGVPDECQDCNENGILDTVDLSGGTPDVNGNGVPDSCERDCNGNALPDEYEIDQGMATDANGNNIPDSCEPDCNNNGTADWVDTNSFAFADVDRNAIPDSCQDCDNNGVADWIDLGRGENIYICDRADRIREYYRTDGYAIQTLGTGAVLDPYDCVFGADRQLYVASSANNRVVKINVDTGVSSIFVAVGSGGLNAPSSLVFGPNGNLFVASRLTNSVIQYSGTTGALIGTFVAAGSGGLTQPYGLVFGPNGNLFVTSNNNTVIQYNGTTGALIGVFVTAGSGTLSGPRGLAFMPDGRLLVASFTNGKLLQYNGTTGASLGQFNNGPVITSVWGVRVGPNGGVYAMRSSGDIRVIEYRASDGLYWRSFVRADALLPTPTGFAFRPGFLHDCNGNAVLDSCDPEWRDLDLFVTQLLADPQLAAYVCMFDTDSDGLLTGSDIQGFLARYLGV